MNKPVQIKAYSFEEMIQSVQEKAEAAAKEIAENGGICLQCGQHPAELNNEKAINQFNCIDCNQDTEDLLDELRGPGFMEVKL